MFNLVSPYSSKAHSYKGQMHCHSNNSNDNAAGQTPYVLMGMYRDAGYSFVCITDHDYATDDPEFNESGSEILFIRGDEETGSGEHHLPIFDKVGDDDSSSDRQTIITNAKNAGSLVTIAHPNYQDGLWSDADFDALIGFNFIEVYNVGVSGYVSEYAEVEWDYLLTKGRKIFGTAVDDYHRIAGFNYGFVIVNADSLTKDEIKTNLQNGNFYASNGADLTISVGEITPTIAIETSSAATIQFIKRNGLIAYSSTNATSAEYECDGTEGYIRVKVIRDSDSKEAWSQPIFIRNVNLPKTQAILMAY